MIDDFVRRRLPPQELWPRLDWSGVAELAYPDRLNCVSELLDRWIVSGHGDRTVFHHAGGPWTYQRLFDSANRIAHVLVENLRLVPGNRVLLRAANQPMLVACWFGVLKAGGIAVSTMPLLRVRELTEIIERANVTLALTDAALATDLEAAMAARPDARIVCFNSVAPRLARSPHVVPIPRPSTTSTRQATIPRSSRSRRGRPGGRKGTVHFHRDLLAVTDTYARYVLRPEPDDIFIGSPPLAFTYALGGLVLFPMRFGASTALLEQATPPFLLAGIESYGATFTVTSPTAYRAMVKQAREYDLSSLRKGLSAGETLPAATFNAWHEATGVRLMDGIGSTEMLHVFIGCGPEAAIAGSTGRVVPGFRAVILDEHGHELPPNSVGRLAVMGPTGCRYLDDLENQQKYVQHGWNVTGDAYVMDEDRYFWYQARTDDMIISSGYNISGPEVENVLLSHPSVADCGVVAAPDPDRGHIVKAFIVPQPGINRDDSLTRQLQDYVKSQLAPYKYPRAIEYVTALPRALTGKLQRYRLRAQAREEAETPRPAPPLAFHEPEGWERPVGYANAVSAQGRVVFIAGQVGWNPATARFETDDLCGQVRQALDNVVAALAAAGATPNQITRLTSVPHRPRSLSSQRKAIGQAYRDIIGRHYPAMAMVVVSGLIEPGALVEIEATAVVDAADFSS